MFTEIPEYSRFSRFVATQLPLYIHPKNDFTRFEKVVFRKSVEALAQYCMVTPLVLLASETASFRDIQASEGAYDSVELAILLALYARRSLSFKVERCFARTTIDR